MNSERNIIMEEEQEQIYELLESGNGYKLIPNLLYAILDEVRKINDRLDEEDEL